VGTGAVRSLDRTCYFCLPREMLHPGSRFQMAGDLVETYLLWLIEGTHMRRRQARALGAVM
jgi:hypothetical protein